MRAGTWVGRGVASQLPDPPGHQLEVPGLVSHLERQTHLQLQVGLVGHPERRHLGGLDLVPERRGEQVRDGDGRGQRRAGLLAEPRQRTEELAIQVVDELGRVECGAAGIRGALGHGATLAGTGAAG
jgi:hypothetical protein